MKRETESLTSWSAVADRVVRALDETAEALVAPSFSKIGYALRSRMYRWSFDFPDLSGKTVVITGGTSGIGLAAALTYARLGADVHLVGRSEIRAQQARRMFSDAGFAPPTIDLVDLAERQEIEDFGQRLRSRYQSIHALVHGAGTLQRSYGENSEGVEQTVATQVLGPYLLSASISQILSSSDSSAIVIVSSGGAYTQQFKIDQLEMSGSNYRGAIAYARAKRAQIVLAPALQRAIGSPSVVSYVMHPGWVDTPGLTHGLPLFSRIAHPFLRTPAEGADTIIWLTEIRRPEDSGLETALEGVFLDRSLRRTHRFARPSTIKMNQTPHIEEDQLLRWCKERTGVSFK